MLWRNSVTEMEQIWWNSGTSDGKTVEHAMAEQCNRDGGKVEQ